MQSRTNHSLPKAVIFDLDGTLIDSATVILTGLEKAVIHQGFTCIKPLDTGLIGPPLRETFQEITGIQDYKTLDLLVSNFKSFYDLEGCLLSKPYPGISHLLDGLFQEGYSIYLATNKRLIPTKKIIQFLLWDGYFKATYAIDCQEIAFVNKSEMLKALIQDERIDIQNAVYIGDRHEDYLASQENHLNFIFVDWGYGGMRATYPNYASTLHDLHRLISLPYE